MPLFSFVKVTVPSIDNYEDLVRTGSLLDLKCPELLREHVTGDSDSCDNGCDDRDSDDCLNDYTIRDN